LASGLIRDRIYSNKAGAIGEKKSKYLKEVFIIE
jgi:hypothetical protein